MRRLLSLNRCGGFGAFRDPDPSSSLPDESSSEMLSRTCAPRPRFCLPEILFNHILAMRAEVLLTGSKDAALSSSLLESSSDTFCTGNRRPGFADGRICSNHFLMSSIVHWDAAIVGRSLSSFELLCSLLILGPPFVGTHICFVERPPITCSIKQRIIGTRIFTLERAQVQTKECI